MTLRIRFFFSFIQKIHIDDLLYFVNISKEKKNEANHPAIHEINDPNWKASLECKYAGRYTSSEFNSTFD